MEQPSNRLPHHHVCFAFGEKGTLVSFYLKNGVAKSGYFARGDWIEHDLSQDEVMKFSSHGFPLKKATAVQINVIDHRHPVHLIFLGEVNMEAVTFWSALTFICSGHFLGKHLFLKDVRVSSLSLNDQDTLKYLETFFSYQTSWGEELCNILCDADRKVLVLRGSLDEEVLGKSFSMPELKQDYPELKSMIQSLLG